MEHPSRWVCVGVLVLGLRLLQNVSSPFPAPMTWSRTPTMSQLPLKSPGNAAPFAARLHDFRTLADLLCSL